MRQALESVLALARTLRPEELPRLLGDLEEIRVTALARISAPAVEAKPDQLLDVNEAARRLNCSPSYLYRHHKKFSFTRPNSVGRALRFSSNGLDAYLRRAR